MGIRFDGLNTSATAPVSLTECQGEVKEVSTPQGMTLDLSKGATLDLTKRKPGLTKITLAAGWDPATDGSAFDIDISAFMLNENGKITSVPDDVIFFNHKEAPGIKYNNDDQTGGSSDGDDETIDIDLAAIPEKYKSIAFTINIFECTARKQTFGMVNNSYARILDRENNNEEICRSVLKGDYSTSTGVVLAKLVRDGGNWKYENVSEGKVVGDLNDLLKLFS